MTIDDVKLSIKNHVLNSISHRDLYTLCNIFAIPIDSRRKINQKNVLDSILTSSDLTLLQHISFMLKKSDREANVQVSTIAAPTIPVQTISSNVARVQPQTNSMNFSLNLRLYCLSNELMKQSPIDLKSEIVTGVNPQNIFVSNYTKYPDGYFNAPSCPPALINGRMNMPNAQLPYVSKNSTIKGSPFYCCQVVLHPLSLLIPKPTPNICQPNRIMSKMQLNFTISSSVRQLITANRCMSNNKSVYKWQILLRFGVYDPVKPFPAQNNDIANLSEYIPPYASIVVNGVPVQLWDILPSNNTAKEGKRHSRPINISDYIRYVQVDDRGYRQIINVNWWQTPGVYLYYYAAVFLERKLDVNELLSQFIKKTHAVQRPKSFTLDFIKEKFSSNNQFHKVSDFEDNEDDLIMSSVLPISLLCPVGKSRITCPLRSVNCQHLQCFDAHLYLMMNERRSVWKCPVCDCQATLDELFVDEYFQQILNDFEHDEEITEVNVNPDGSYISVAVKESREDRKHSGTLTSNIEKSKESTDSVNCASNSNSTESQPVILLESDDEKSSTSPSIFLHQPICPSVETIKTNTQVVPEKGDCTIDLTSDSDEETGQAIPNNPKTLLSSELPESTFLRNNAPKPTNNQSEPINYIKPTNDNNQASNSTFQRMPVNCPLLLPNSNIPNLVWIPNQNYQYVYQPENSAYTKKYIPPQSILPNRQLSTCNPQSSPPFGGKKNLPKVSIAPVRPIVRTSNVSTVPALSLKSMPIPSLSSTNSSSNTNPAWFTMAPVSSISRASTSDAVPQCTLPNIRISPIKTPVKVDPFSNIENLIGVNKPGVSSISSSSSRKPKRKGAHKAPKPRPSGARSSSRLQSQSQKKYFMSSGSSNDDSNSDDDISNIGDFQKNKRQNPFNDSDSDFECSVKKRRRFVLDQSSDEEVSLRSLLIDKIMNNLNLPIICLTRLDEDTLKRYVRE